jgi:8-oxo-dGTP pyrophosphatase MutT (NUDIX family)
MESPSSSPSSPSSPSPFAVFAVVWVGKKLIATTRPADRHKDDAGAGKYGLPGGKVDAGETPEQALVREAEEEGWALKGKLQLAYTAQVQGRTVCWYTAEGAEKLATFKEMGRISPVEVSPEKLNTFGNDRAISACLAST